jgi:hypothetical protein
LHIPVAYSDSSCVCFKMYCSDLSSSWSISKYSVRMAWLSARNSSYPSVNVSGSDAATLSLVSA